MAYAPAADEKVFDFRIYVGMLFFRWQIIVLCFLYCLLGGVIYLQVVPREYVTSARVLRYAEQNVRVTTTGSPWTTLSSYIYLLQSDELGSRVARKLATEWGERIGSQSALKLPVTIRQSRGLGQTLDLSVRSRDAHYGEAFLATLLEEHKPEWESMQQEASESAIRLLEKELARLEEKIRQAEEELIEYQRLHDIARVDARGSVEAAYLQALVSRRSMLSTELMLFEHQFPFLKDAGVGVLNQAEQLTLETGQVKPARELLGDEEGTDEEPSVAGAARDQESVSSRAEKEVDSIAPVGSRTGTADDGTGWQDLRLRLAELERRDQELAKDLKPEHPQRQTIQKQIGDIRSQLDLSAKLKFATMMERHSALKMQLDALEEAEYKWQAKNLYASQRRAELKRIASTVSRFENNYRAVYTRLHDLRVSEELEGEHYHVLQAPRSSSKPVWPEPQKVLLVTVVLGLGSGFGIALLLQVLDNKIQSIRDVEKFLGVPFLGGVPFWVHSGLENSIRPIVTEERASGAIEAYRALRTSLISALKKVNEKIVIVTSADSREGKTLTTLNLAIMVAEMGKKVLVIDMDLRRGRLHRSLGVEKEPGVADVLADHSSLRNVIKSTRVENLFLAPAGRPIENSAELMQGSDLVSLLVEVQDDYEYVFIDTSPVLRVTDTVVLANQGIGVVVYIARVNHTPKPLIRYSLDMLGDARILGLIMNSIEMHKISSLYYTYQYPNYAYYSNAYAYGYNYYLYDQSTGDGPKHRKSRRPLGRVLESVVTQLRRTFLPMD